MRNHVCTLEFFANGVVRLVKFLSQQLTGTPVVKLTTSVNCWSTLVPQDGYCERHR